MIVLNLDLFLPCVLMMCTNDNYYMHCENTRVVKRKVHGVAWVIACTV